MSESTIVLTKDQRVNLINRRSVAWILEFIPIYVVSTLVLSLISASDLLAWLMLAVWLGVRDLWGASWGKKLVGLDVAPIDDASREVSPGSRVLRNAPLMVPLVPIVEFFVAYLGSDPQMKRIGDRLAGTRIVDRFPDTQGRGSWSGMLVLALVVAGGAQYALKRMLGGP
ncbi:MAG: RDD family protein [Myxococcales bacterium]|nr:RDD family protein [Myxococcales bacterium]